MAEHPETFDELFKFYHEYVKVLYSSVQVENELPVELLFELNAALDHVSRHWCYKENEKEVVEKAYSHFKRGCLDVFKLRVKKSVDQYNELSRTEISLIDNGEFEKNLKTLIQRIRHRATEARRLEGRIKAAKDGSIQAFAAWQPVFQDCVSLEKDFYYHPKLNWAKKTGFWRKVRHFVLGVLTGALVLAFMEKPLSDLIVWGVEHIKSWFQ
jgi:hypothetical protein